MRILFTLIASIIISQLSGQCTFTNIEIIPGHFRSQCNSLHFTGSIANQFFISEQCGDLYLWPPRTSDDDIVSTFNPVIDNVVIFPNPFTNHLIIDFGQESHQVKEVRIVNILGQNMERYTALSTKEQLLPLAHLASGTYFLILISHEENSIITKKIIKL